MRPFSEMGDEELGAALRAIRPQPSPAFTSELDQRAATGFPPRSAPGPFASVLDWLRGGSAWRWAIPAGGVAVAAIAVATVIVSINHRGPEPQAISRVNADGGGTMGGPAGLEQPPNHAAPAHHASKNAPSGSTGSPSGSVLEYEAEIPTSGATTAHRAASAGANATAEADAEPTTGAPRHRDVERAANITIGAKPDEIARASSKVFEAVHAYDGIVLESSTRDGSDEQGEATFELLIPSGKVGDAMAAFGRIGEVVSRDESTADITAPTVGASERLQDSEARIDGLLAQLSEATTESEREVVEDELDSERHHAAHLKSKLSGLNRRASLSRVSVRVVGVKGAQAPGGGGGDGGWGIGDALHDAGHLLSVAAGVTIVGLAVLAPLMLLALLAWLAGRAWTRRARERALT